MLGLSRTDKSCNIVFVIQVVVQFNYENVPDGNHFVYFHILIPVHIWNHRKLNAPHTPQRNIVLLVCWPYPYKTDCFYVYPISVYYKVFRLPCRCNPKSTWKSFWDNFCIKMPFLNDFINFEPQLLIKGLSEWDTL